MKNEEYTETKNGLTIKIYQDDNCYDTPNDWGDDSLFLVGYHRDFTVERDAVVTQGQCRAIFTRDPDEDEQAVAKELRRKYHIYGLEAYIHSGVRLALSHEGNFPDRQWDVSQLGAVFVSRKEWKSAAKARKAALGLIETWNDALSCNIYGFVVEDERGNNLESCWGSYGDYQTSGILDQARSIAKTHSTKVEKTKRSEMYKQADIAQARALVKPYRMTVK